MRQRVRKSPAGCCFCGYEGLDRTYRNVGTAEYPDDLMCNLCDTETNDEG